MWNMDRNACMYNNVIISVSDPHRFILPFEAHFISCWIRIRIRNADPDPGGKFNTDPDTDPDPDPKQW